MSGGAGRADKRAGGRGRGRRRRRASLLVACQTRTVRSSEHVTHSPVGSSATAYTNDSDACSTRRHSPPSSHSRTVPSFDPERKPTPATSARSRTTSWWPSYVFETAPVWPSHSLIVRSADAVSTRPSASSSGSTDHTALSWPLSVSTHAPSRHTRAVLSHDAEYSRSPLAPARTHETTSSCPSSTRAGAFVARSHSITCLSFEPDASPSSGVAVSVPT